MITGELRTMLVAVTGRDELADLAFDAPLLHEPVGLDSMTGVRLLRAVQERYGVDVAAEDLNLDALASLAALGEFVGNRADPSLLGDLDRQRLGPADDGLSAASGSGPAGEPGSAEATRPGSAATGSAGEPGSAEAPRLGSADDGLSVASGSAATPRPGHSEVAAESSDAVPGEYATLRKLEAYTPKKLYLVDATYGDSPILGDIAALEAAARDAVDAAGGHVLTDSHVVFPNGAVTLVLILAESHLSLHTWPEENLVAIDLFSCGAIRGRVVIDRLATAFGLGEVPVREIDRG